MLPSYATAADLVADLVPEAPVHALHPAAVTETARQFVDGFPGEVLYAVKCNDDPRMLDALAAGGVDRFDVASMAELEAVAGRFAGAACHFMHPVKARGDIARAYRVHGVRVFALDCAAELDKIRATTGDAADLELMVRLDVPRGAAVQDLGGKFGAGVEEAAALLRAGARTADGRPRRVGLTFHVGSQCLNPGAWREAIALAAAARDAAGVPIAALDVGGGFPAAYLGI
jgi:ornithine decarboxylase